MAAEHEKTIIATLLEATKRGWRLFKNAQGLGYSGKKTQTFTTSNAHYITLKNFRVIKYGVCNPGGLDLIGWQTVEITPDMVGKKFALFTAVDAKTKGYKTLSKEQKNFIKELTSAGGEAYVSILEDGQLLMERKK